MLVGGGGLLLLLLLEKIFCGSVDMVSVFAILLLDCKL